MAATKQLGPTDVSPPELEDMNEDINDKRVDVWSIGALMLTLFSHDNTKIDADKKQWKLSAEI